MTGLQVQRITDDPSKTTPKYLHVLTHLEHTRMFLILLNMGLFVLSWFSLIPLHLRNQLAEIDRYAIHSSVITQLNSTSSETKNQVSQSVSCLRGAGASPTLSNTKIFTSHQQVKTLHAISFIPYKTEM